MNSTIKSMLPAFIVNKFIGRVGLQKITINIGWLFFDKVLRMGSGLFVGVWVARYLGPEQFGMVNYTFAFVALFGAISTLGLDSIVIRDIVSMPEKTNELLGSAFVLKLIGGFLVFILAAISILFIRPHNSLMFFLVLISSLGCIFQAFNTIDFYFQAHILSKFTVWANNIAFLVVSILKVILIVNKSSLIAFAWVFLLESILSSIFILIAYQYNKQNIFRWKPAKRMAVNLLRQSWPLILSSMAIMIYMRIDQIMLGNMRGDIAVGNYSAAVKISEIWYFIPMNIMTSVYPALIAIKKQSQQKYIKRTHQLALYMLYGTVAFSLIVTFTSKLIVNLLYGNEFSQASNALTIHIWTGVPVFVSLVYNRIYLIEGLIKECFYFTFISVIINVLLNLIMIPKFGISGAATATLITQSTGLLIGMLYLKYKIHNFI